MRVIDDKDANVSARGKLQEHVWEAVDNVDVLKLAESEACRTSKTGEVDLISATAKKSMACWCCWRLRSEGIETHMGLR